ncbi:MAG: hypothetical protein A2991_01315 [Candidatus Terrybacteria bacterium RIFCSPLOWO2_01_FULL_58_14]|uniref:FAD/NAD(P)-binding domain-containing protein n=2 Tax=Candidatus Terryibacteriota TaxID=1817920 RepID=A0A1G2Q0T9_9BACT|nr:MAG: hypothetical protein A2682_01705 [Candidatus Terrybacteria bacterium RIFCSPHIGHO2_01_FULL_58_15]OHA53461.1 MAG: hypothetical protein A2991_01315 [Candidatus Terrybacteria bacterium RIFCSPLOWO2_01_FULL_58_14]
MYELVIIGGGPAGAAAGVYAARKRVKSLLITEGWGGQSEVSPDVQNWIGIKSISGIDLAQKIEEHVKAYAGDVLEFDEGSRVVEVKELVLASGSGGPKFTLVTNKGKKYETRSILVASGGRRRKLSVPGAETYDGKGIVYCATCDAPLFQGKEVVVIGGGNAGFESAQQLISYATKITLLEYAEEFRGDSVTREAVLKSKKVTPITNAESVEVKGEKFVTALVWKDRKTGETHELPVQGVFVEIGSIPNTEFLKGLVELNKYGEIILDHKTARTSREGIWAAGDATDQPYKQNNISMGDAVKALEDIYLWLQKKKSTT